MESIFFGHEQELFGAYHPAASVACGAVVICSPMSAEWLAIHRVLRLLADRLADGGFAVLRFDYFGCGDSAGEHQEAHIDRWIGDIGSAIELLANRAPDTPVSLVGIRLGALLACRAALLAGGVERLVLWDAPADGAAHAAELRALHRQMLRTAHVIAADHDRRDPLPEVLGFPVRAHFWHELEALSCALPRSPAGQALLIDTQRRSSTLATQLTQTGTVVEHRHIDHPELWTWVEDVARLRLPHAVISQIAEWLLASRP